MVSLTGIFLYTFGDRVDAILQEKRILSSKASDDNEFGLGEVQVVIAVGEQSEEDEEEGLAHEVVESREMRNVVGKGRSPRVRGAE